MLFFFLYKCYYKSDGLINAKKRIPYRINKVATGIYITPLPLCFIGFVRKRHIYAYVKC